MSDAGTALLLMPFAPEFEECDRDIFRPALAQLGYTVVRADELSGPRPIMDDLRRQICEADLLVAEMTGRNPNVFYELGLAHAIGKPVILVSQREEDVPFDLRHVRVLGYARGRRAWKHDLRLRIQEAARKIQGASDPWPPPLVCPKPAPRYGIRIVSPPADAEVEMGVVMVAGTYAVLPPHRSFNLFIATPAGHECWPQGPVRFNDDGTWEGEVALYDRPARQASIFVAEVGESGRALIEYYGRTGEAAGSWLPLRQLTSDILVHDRTRIAKRAG